MYMTKYFFIMIIAELFKNTEIFAIAIGKLFRNRII